LGHSNDYHSNLLCRRPVGFGVRAQKSRTPELQSVHQGSRSQRPISHVMAHSLVDGLYAEAALKGSNSLQNFPSLFGIMGYTLIVRGVWCGCLAAGPL